MKLFLSLFFAFVALQGFAQEDGTHVHYLADPDAAEREHSVDITHMKVEVGFEPSLGKVNGKVTHQFTTIQKNISTLFFDAPDIKILTAAFDNEPVKFTTDDKGVTVQFSKALIWGLKPKV